MHCAFVYKISWVDRRWMVDEVATCLFCLLLFILAVCLYFRVSFLVFHVANMYIVHSYTLYGMYIVQKHGYHLPSTSVSCNDQCCRCWSYYYHCLPLILCNAFSLFYFSEWARLWLMVGSELLWHVRSKLFGQLPVTWMQCYKIVRLTRCEPFQTQCTANACQTCRQNQLVSFIRLMIQ